MINEILEGAKINFMDRKESDLERKVRKLEKDMMDLDSILNKENLVRKKSMENQQSVASDATILDNNRLPKCMAHGDGPDSWQGMPVHIYHYSTSSQVHPAFFFTWDCTPYDFHNKSAHRSIYTLVEQLQPMGCSMSADHFKKQLSALLAVHKETTSKTNQAEGYHHIMDDIGSTCEVLSPSTSKLEPDIEKPYLGTENSDPDIKISEPDDKIPDLETKELLINLEKKLKQVESKCRDDFRTLNPFTANETKNEDNVVDSYNNKTEEIDQDNVIIDDLIFEMFQDPHEESERKPIELAKEVDGLLKSYQQVGGSMFQKFELKK